MESSDYFSGKRTGIRNGHCCYTRALDKLTIFDQVLNIPDKKTWLDEEDTDDNDAYVEPTKEKDTKESPKKPEKKSEKKESIQEGSLVREYFEKEGLKVVDLRNKGGMLWVIGEKEKIKPYVDHAMKKYKISGMYTTSKVIGFKNGWCTKTKK